MRFKNINNLKVTSMYYIHWTINNIYTTIIIIVNKSTGSKSSNYVKDIILLNSCTTFVRKFLEAIALHLCASNRYIKSLERKHIRLKNK